MCFNLRYLLCRAMSINIAGGVMRPTQHALSKNDPKLSSIAPVALDM